jgi:uncharacterized protein (DUF697 family)
VRAAFEGLGDGAEARALATAYRRVMLSQTTVEEESAKLESDDLRRYAFEMAVAACDADGHHGEAEQRFLDRLRNALGLDPAASAAIVEEADALADLDPAEAGEETPGMVAGTAAPAAAAAIATIPGATAATTRDVSAEVDASVLKYAILNGGLELLPQGLATMAIVPLQIKMVYRVGKAYGVSLDRGHVKEFIATVGVGMTSQVVENFARDLLGGLAKRFLGKAAGKMTSTATGAMMSFATTYALGQVAKQYYAGGRTLSSVDLRSIFGREVERAKGLYEQHRPQVEASAKSIDPRQILAMARGA